MNIKRKTGDERRLPGRPAAFKRETAVQAAMDIFWSRGFDAAPVSDLADAMGITRSSFYNSFSDRESAFLEALAAYRKIAPDKVLATVRAGQPVKAVLRKLLKEICHFLVTDSDGRGCFVVNSIGELVRVNEELGASIEETVLDTVKVYEKLFRQAVSQGEIGKPGDTRAAARAFFSFVCGLSTISKVIRDEGELWRMCEVFLTGMGLTAGEQPQRMAKHEIKG